MDASNQPAMLPQPAKPTATSTSAVLLVRAARAGKCRKKCDIVAVLWKTPAIPAVQRHSVPVRYASCCLLQPYTGRLTAGFISTNNITLTCR